MRYLILNVSTEDDDDAGPFLAGVALTGDLLTRLQEHVTCFREAHRVYPSLASIETFDYSLEYYEKSSSTIMLRGIRRHRREGYGGKEETQLADPLFDYDDASSPVSVFAASDREFCLVDANKIPTSGGNVRTECNSLHLCYSGTDGYTVELWWTCLRKDTSCELRTATITSLDLAMWSAKLATESE